MPSCSRRRVLALALGLPLALPLTAAAQAAPKVRRIGVLIPGKAGGPNRMGGFFEEMRALGYIEGENLHIERRYSEGDDKRLPEVAAGLAKADVELILAAGPIATSAAAQATKTVPIVMGTHDPVEQGIVKSLARPGGNVTGWSVGTSEMLAKQLSMLREAIPSLRRVALLKNPQMRGYSTFAPSVDGAVRAAQVEAVVFDVAEGEAIAPAFAAARKQRVEAVLVLPDPTIDRLAPQLAAEAARERLPAMYGWKFYVQLGGLMSYGASLETMVRRWAPYVDRILKGAKPGDLPIETPREYELVLNQRAARELRFTFPPAWLVAAAEVIS